MTMLVKTLAAIAVGGAVAASCFIENVFAQSAQEIRGPSPYVAIENEPAPKLVVHPPLSD